MDVVAEISIFPMDKGESVSRWVARAVAVIRKSGLPHNLGPMGTCIEGSWDDVMKVVDDCFRALAEDSDRVYLTLKVDARRGAKDRLTGKLTSVERRLS